MAQKAERMPNPKNTVLDGKTAAVGASYPDTNFINPWNNGLDGQYGNEDGHANDTRTLYSPTRTIDGMGVLSLNGEDSYDSNWEHGVRGPTYTPKGGADKATRWTPRGGKR